MALEGEDELRGGAVHAVPGQSLSLTALWGTNLTTRGKRASTPCGGDDSVGVYLKLLKDVENGGNPASSMQLAGNKRIFNPPPLSHQNLN